MAQDTLNMGTSNVLANGAEIVQRWQVGQVGKDTTETPDWIVLAKWGNEYATWRVSHDGHAYWGHYFNTYSAAMTDYQKRVRWVFG
jgi:hypothetical protein